MSGQSLPPAPVLATELAAVVAALELEEDAEVDDDEPVVDGPLEELDAVVPAPPAPPGPSVSSPQASRLETNEAKRKKLVRRMLRSLSAPRVGLDPRACGAALSSSVVTNRARGIVRAGLALVLAACAPAVDPPAPPPAPAPTASVPELLAESAARCAGPEGLTDCAPGAFEATFQDQLTSFRAHRAELERQWTADVEAGGHSAAYGLAWLGAVGAVPSLRRTLLADRNFYGWESSDAETMEARMRDDQYPHQMARILAIEHLTKRPIQEAVALTIDERALLVAEAFALGEPGEAQDVARWMLWKLAPGAISTTITKGAAWPAEGTSASAVAAPEGLEGLVVAAHDHKVHHDFAVLARVGGGTVGPIETREGCRRLPSARVVPTTKERGAAIPLPARPFRSAGNPCIFEVPDLAKGDFIATLGFSATGEAPPLPDREASILSGRALELLARHHRVDPAKFTGKASLSVIGSGAARLVAVNARAIPRAKSDQGVSLAIVYQVPEDGSSPRERLVVASADTQVVRVAGFVAWSGADPLVAVSRWAPDGWDFELYAVGRDAVHLVARGAEGSGA